jgi:parallel beta-helix repeat protein
VNRNVEVKASDDYPVHNLNTGLNYTTIQEAINAPETENGHTINADSGIYFEHIQIDKSISLIGENESTAIIDGNSTGTVIAMYADFTMIRGFTIQHSGFFWGANGITIGFYSNCTITDNTIVLNQVGIGLGFGGNHTITNNTISSNHYGMGITYSSNNRIFHNRFLNNTQHVDITGSDNKWTDGYPSGGNYWDDYTDVDLKKGPYQDIEGSDGIWDHPYFINDINWDYYPIVPEFQSFLILQLFMIATLIATMIIRRKPKPT